MGCSHLLCMGIMNIIGDIVLMLVLPIMPPFFVQIVPHVTDEIQEWIEDVSKKPVDGTKNEPDVCLIEVGGTVGDIESMVFLEALRQFQFKVGQENIMLVHVSLVPCLGAVCVYEWTYWAICIP